ncbi:MAG: protein kinase [Planctomycetes bacterium]|nr:protein kinase [Planctomycetota bacterium]
MPKLVIEKGADKGRTLDITDPGSYIIGRDNSAHLKLTDSLISRLHIKIESSSAGFTVTDMDSLNGTIVNGEQIKERKGAVGDIIELGETAISVLDEAEGAKLDALVGQTIGGYRVIERVGRGGMGTVYKAIQLRLNRIIALKLLSEELVKDPTFINLFVQEARSAAQLNHPNIIQVYDFNKSGTLCYFSMEFVPYGSVQELLAKEKKLPQERAIKIILDACAGLEYAEKKGIVHRDIKPDNLMIAENDVVKIGDLGLAKSLKDRSQKDQGIFGTPHYIAPEQALGKDVDHKADIYSLGATFYRILTGSTPYSGANVKEIITRKIKEDAKPLKSVMPEMPDKLCNIVDKMMKRLPEERYQSSTAIIKDLQDYLKQPEDPKPKKEEAAPAASERPLPRQSSAASVAASAATLANKKKLTLTIGLIAAGLLLALVFIAKALIPAQNDGEIPKDPVEPTPIANPPTGIDEELDRRAKQLMGEADAKYAAIDYNNALSIFEAISAYKRVILECAGHPDLEKARAKITELQPQYDVVLAKNQAKQELEAITGRYKADFEELSSALQKNPDIASDVQTFYETFMGEYTEFAKQYPNTPESAEALNYSTALKNWYEKFSKEQREYSMCHYEANSLLSKDNFGGAADKIRNFQQKFPDGIFSTLAKNRVAEIENSALQKFSENVQKPVYDLVQSEKYDSAIDLIASKKQAFNLSKLDPKFSELVKYVEKKHTDSTKEKDRIARENDARIRAESLLQTIPAAREYDFAKARNDFSNFANKFQTPEGKQWANFTLEKLKGLVDLKDKIKLKLGNYAEGQLWRNVKFKTAEWTITGADDKNLQLQNSKKIKITVDWKEISVDDILSVFTERGALLKKRFNYDDALKIAYLYFEWGQFAKGSEFLVDLRKKVTEEINPDKDPKDLKSLKETLERINIAIDFFNTEPNYYNSFTKILYDTAVSESEGTRNQLKDALERLQFIKDYMNTTDEYQRIERTIDTLITELQKKLK